MQVYGQQKKPVQDSTQLYKKIETYSQKSKFTKLLHKWVFRSTEKESKRVTKVRKNYKPYEGKIIRNIIIDSKDPFGHSVTDTTQAPNSWLERTGNKIHIKSKNLAIRNFLLLKEGQRLDTFLIAESARLLRAQNYIREVSIQPKFVSTSKDSIDVIISTLDAWSLIPKAELSTSQTKLGIRERNIMGTGHQLGIDYSKRLQDGNNAFDGSYTVPNFKNTFIRGIIRYKIDYDNHYEKSVGVERKFYSPLTRWAGGIHLEERFLERFFPDDSLGIIDKDLKFISQDYWGGHSFRIFKGNTERERTTNLIVSARLLFVNYKEHPDRNYDKIHYFSNENLFLLSTGIASRQFLEDSYIFKDGITEDVPVGIVYSVTGGIQNKNHLNRMYLGAQVFYANYFKWGFFSTNCEVGSFFNGSKTEQTAYSFSFSYFSNLWTLGGEWKMRQFIKPQFILGTNRKNSVGDRLSLNENPDFNGVYSHLDRDKTANIPGFESPNVGTQKYVLALQTQFYSPWEFLGFRLNPFVNITMGMLRGKESSIGTNNLYSSIGLGCIIRNDYLVFDSFQLSLSYYPQIPGQGDNIFKTNAFANDDFGFQDFQIGKPETVLYK